MFFYFLPNYNVHNPLWNKQVCTKFINVIIENNLLHISCAKSTLCNVVINGSLLSSHIFIWTYHFCFAVTWFTSVTIICLFVSSNESGIKSENCCVIWHVAAESKIQLVNCELSLKYLLELLLLPDIRPIDAYIFWLL